MRMGLQYLIFDASDDGEGTGTWDAMASVRVEHLPAVMQEVQTVLAWAEAHSPGPRGPLDEGGVWDADQQVQTDGEWTTVTLTVTGPWGWGDGLVQSLSGED
jgi:hypothetical protein